MKIKGLLRYIILFICFFIAVASYNTFPIIGSLFVLCLGIMLGIYHERKTKLGIKFFSKKYWTIDEKTLNKEVK